jgi:hypothetical protein
MRVDGDISRPRLSAIATVVTLLAAATLAFFVPAARARTYGDVPKGHWARAQIDWVTDQGPAGRKVLDDFGASFKPNELITRAQLARAVVIASGRQGDAVDPVKIADVPDDHPYFHDIALAIQLRLMGKYKDGFHPDSAVTSWQADRAVVRALKKVYPDDDWSLLTALGPGTWEPNAGFKTGAPRYFPSEVAARYLELHFNHPSTAEGQEVSPREKIERDEVAYILYQALHVNAWRIDGLAAFGSITLPKLTARQKEIVKFACRYIGYPYVWAGEYPAKDSPYGRQAHGGFDCSGFVWWVMKIHFGYRLDERVAADMAAAAKRRITRANLIPGDVIFWGYDGPKSKPASIYHAGIYLGKGWFIHSTGSSDGVSLASLNWTGWSWKTDFAWGRRVLKAGEFRAPTAASVAADLVCDGPAPPPVVNGLEAPPEP